MECVFAKTEVYEQLGEPIFHFLFTGNSQDFLKKASFFIELGLFEQKNGKLCKKLIKTLAPALSHH